MRFVYPALVPFLQSEFHGLTTTGVLLTVLWGAYAIGHVPGGIIGDRIGEGNILVLSTAISAGAVLVVVTAVNVWMLFAGTITFGLATALCGPTRFTILTDIYAKQAGSAIGLTMAAGSLDNAGPPVVATVLATYLAWRFGFGVFFPLFVLVLIALWLAVPGRTSSRTSAVDAVSLRTVRRITRGVTRESIPTIVAIQTTVSFIIQGFSSFYPTYLTATKGASPELAATLFGVFFAIGAIIQPIAGNMMDRIEPWRTLILSFGGCILALWVLPFVHGVLPLVIVMLLLSSWNGCGVIENVRRKPTAKAVG